MPFLRIGVDSREAVRGFRDYERAADRAQRGTREFDDRLKQTEGSFARFSRGVSGAQVLLASLATGTTALAIRRLFELGTAVEETHSKFRTVFGPQAGSVNAFLDEFANKAGLTNQQGQELAATAGAIAQGMGFAGQEAAGFAEQILRVSGDLASFNNRDIEQAFAAVRSGITGEREALKTLGIVLSETDVQKRALADSGKALASQLTAEDKAAANLALIMERAGVAIGDLDRTQDSAANKARNLTAQIGDLRDVIATEALVVFDAMLADLLEMAGGFDALERRIKGAGVEVLVFTKRFQQVVELASALNPIANVGRGRGLFGFPEAIARAKELQAEIEQIRADAEFVGPRLEDAGAAAARNFGRAADDTERMARAVERIARVSIGSPTVIGPDGFPVPTTGDLAGTRRFGRNQGPFVTSPALADFSDQSFEGLRRAIEGFDEADARAAGLADTLFASIPGIVSLADGVLGLDGHARSALRGIGDLAGGLSRLGQGSFLGNLPGILGIAGGAVNLLGGLFGDNDTSARVAEEQARAAENARRFAEALEDATRALEEDLSVRRLIVQGLDEEAERRRFLLGQQAQAAGFRERFAAGDSGRVANLVRQIDELVSQGQLGADAFAELERLGTLPGISPEVIEAARQYLELLELQGLELEAFNRAQDEAIQKERERIEALRLSFSQDLDIREADLSGDDRLAFETRLAVQIERERAAAEALLASGEITQELFDKLAAVLDGELNQALDAFNQRLEDQARQLEAASRALEADLEVRALLATGQREEADLLRLQIAQQAELNRRIEEGISDRLLDRLREVQGLELDALLNQQTRGGELLGRAPTNTPDTVSVTSIQEVTATNILFINRAMLAELTEQTALLRSLNAGGGLTVSQALGQEFAQARRLSGNPIRQAA